MSDLHLPGRPSWICCACSQLWPCEPARRRLLAEFDGAPISLELYMAGQFTAAAEDLPFVPAGELYRRFLAWVRTKGITEPGI